jgi:hypothetical protein
MKKYLLGFFSIVIAISLSAYNAPKQKAAKTTSTLNYWEYNPGTQQLGDSLGEFDPVADRNDLIAVSCPDNGTIQCARGYSSPSEPQTQQEIDNFQDKVAHN